MWKKALWIYLILFVVGFLGYFIYDAIVALSNNEFDPTSLIGVFVMLIPAAVLYFELRGKKVFILITIIAILIVAVPLLGIFNFNDFNLATIGKALIFVPMLVGLIYFGYKRLFRKK
ncbi:MAG: hypothetical protein H8D34_12675 [Chloroflexi bacterium]|nr:hypothetical protein [Chloroflexota bacterium]